MATDNANTIEYLKHIYEQKVKHNEKEQATLNASKKEIEDKVSQHRLEFLSLANEVVAEDMKHNKAAESTKIIKQKSKKLMAEYLDAVTEIALLEAEMECLQTSSVGENKLLSVLEVHDQKETSVEKKRDDLENALNIFKTKREEMALMKGKLTRRFDEQSQECMKMVAFCDQAQSKINSWVCVPSVLQTNTHKANLHESVCYLNEKIVECRDELTGYCKHKLITCKRKQRMIQDQYKEYLIQQEIRRNGGTLDDESHRISSEKEDSDARSNKEKAGGVAGVHPLAEKDPKAPTIIANGVSVPIASLDLDTLEELCNMERTLLNTSLPTKHFEDDIVENEVKQASSSKFAAFRRDARDAKNNGHGSNGTNSNKPETNSPVRAPAKRKQSMGTALVALDKHQHVEGSTVMGDPSLSGILGGSSPMLMTASQKRAHRKKLSKQLSNSTHVSVQSFDFESEESNKALITALLEMAHDEGQLEHALSLKQGLETHILGLASVLTKSYDYLNSKYPEYKREYYQKQVERYEQQKSGRYSSGASTVFMKNIHQNNGEGKVGAATGAYERVRKIAFHNQKLTKEILANNRKNSTVGCFGSVPESVNRSNNSSTSGTTTTTNTTNPSSNQDAMSLQRHTWKYAQRLFDESIVLETDIRQLQFLTKYNLNLKHPTFTSHAHGHRLDSHGVSSSDSSSSISSGHADDDDLIQQLQLAALRDQGQQKYSEQQHTTGDSSSAHRPSRYHGHEHGNGHGSAPDVIKTIESIDTDAFADSFVYPTGASASASMGARVMVMGRNNRQSESGEAAGMGVKPAPMTRARSSTVGDNDMLDPSGQAWQTPPVAHSATGKVSGYSHLVTKDAAGDSKGATDHSLKGELSSEMHLQHMMHNTHEIKHRSFIAHNHHRAGGYSHSNGHGHEGTPSDPFIPPRIITNDSLYQALPISTDSRAHTRASGRNVSAGHAGHLFLNEFQPYEVPGSRGASADGRSRNLQSGSGSRGSSFPSHQQGGGLGLGEQQPASVTVDSYLDYPLADVGSELPMGANFRRLMDHVQATEYKMNTTVEEKISSIAGDLGSNSVPGQDFRLIDVPITPEMFMVKLASTLNEWRSGSTPEHYEDLITPLVNNNNGNTERRLNASVGVGGMSGSSNGSGGPGKDGSFYRSMHVQPVTGRTPMPRRTVMPRLSICVLTEI